MSFLPPNHSNGNGNGSRPFNQPTNGNGRSPEESPYLPPEDRGGDPGGDHHKERSRVGGERSDNQGDDRKPEQMPDKLNPDRVRNIKQQMNRLYIILVVVGLTIGLVVSVGVVAVIQRLGLTEVVPIGEPNPPAD
ncbi:hypothetical protein [Egbenema bharatensis]|uniref:hypothetical protein n=1 Tax=Egbenema bharatensis TaxID=3463334 RepID=UPI003A8BDB31